VLELAQVDADWNLKWLLNIILKWLRWDDPKLSPIAVRVWLALLMLAFSGIIACNLTLRQQLNVYSIVLAFFAAGIRHWRRIVTDHDLQKVSNEIAYMGSSTTLSVGDST